jgi:hypothetical protein
MPDKKKPASKRPPKTALAKPMPDMPGAGKLDQKLVDTAVVEINRLHREKKIEAVKAMGEFVVKTFFNDNFAHFHSHGRKHASFRALAKREDLSVGYVTIRNSVAFVEQLKMLPAKAATELPASHHRLLLPVASVEDKKTLAAKAMVEGLSARDLEQEVRKLRSKSGAKRGPGRRPDPAFVVACRHLTKVVAIVNREAASKADFTRFPVDDAEKLVGDAEKCLKTLGDAMEKARKAIAEFREKNK